MTDFKLSRRSFVGAAGSLALGADALAQAPAGRALRPVKVMSSLPTLTSAATYLIEGRKFDNAHGLAAEILQTGGSSSLQIDGVLSRNADFGCPGSGTALAAIREGAELKILGAFANNQLVTVISNEKLKQVGVSPSAPIGDRVRALKGMTIATNPIGATYYMMFRTYLKQYGLDPDKDVRLVGIQDSSAMISGIQQGRFDAICSASGIVEQAIALKAGTVWFSGARGDFPGSDKNMVIVLIARTETVEKEPALVDAMRAAYGDALTAINDNHAASGALLKEKYFPKFDPEIWKLVWEGAKLAYPRRLIFPQGAYDFWIENDPKGAASFKNVDYNKIVYPAAMR